MSLFRSLILLLGASAAANAGLVTYNINFTTGAGLIAPTAGSFTYDTTKNVFTNFTVTWDSFVYDFLMPGGQGGNNPYVQGTACGTMTPQAAFAAMTTANECGPKTLNSWLADSANGFILGGNDGSNANNEIEIFALLGHPGVQTLAAGMFTVTLVSSAAPEPSTILLTLAGGAVLLAGRRRMAGVRNKDARGADALPGWNPDVSRTIDTD